jgi:hypothetical protein
VSVIYIILGVLCLILSIIFLDKREKLFLEKKKMADMKEDIEKTNQQLNDISEQLLQINEPLQKVETICKGILSYRR